MSLLHHCRFDETSPKERSTWFAWQSSLADMVRRTLPAMLHLSSVEPGARQAQKISAWNSCTFGNTEVTDTVCGPPKSDRECSEMVSDSGNCPFGVQSELESFGCGAGITDVPSALPSCTCKSSRLSDLMTRRIVDGRPGQVDGSANTVVYHGASANSRERRTFRKREIGKLPAHTASLTWSFSASLT